MAAFLTGGLGKVYLLTTDDILGSAGLKDVTKGVRSVLADFCSCG